MHHWMGETHVSSRGSLLIIAHTFHGETKQAKRYEKWNLQQFEQWTGFRLLCSLTQHCCLWNWTKLQQPYSVLCNDIYIDKSRRKQLQN
jgi:hypothetical protein